MKSVSVSIGIFNLAAFSNLAGPMLSCYYITFFSEMELPIFPLSSIAFQFISRELLKNTDTTNILPTSLSVALGFMLSIISNCIP
jgi:hypothetical protein